MKASTVRKYRFGTLLFSILMCFRKVIPQPPTWLVGNSTVELFTKQTPNLHTLKCRHNLFRCSWSFHLICPILTSTLHCPNLFPLLSLYPSHPHIIHIFWISSKVLGFPPCLSLFHVFFFSSSMPSFHIFPLWAYNTLNSWIFLSSILSWAWPHSVSFLASLLLLSSSSFSCSHLFFVPEVPLFSHFITRGTRSIKYVLGFLLIWDVLGNAVLQLAIWWCTACIGEYPVHYLKFVMPNSTTH